MEFLRQNQDLLEKAVFSTTFVYDGDSLEACFAYVPAEPI